jgi:hypothetical protein
VGVQGLREGLPAAGKVPEVKAVAEEQPPVVGDQIELGGDPPYGAAAAQQPRQRGPRGAGSLPRKLPRAQPFRSIGDLMMSHSL